MVFPQSATIAPWQALESTTQIFTQVLHAAAGAKTIMSELPLSFLEHAQWDRVLMHSKRMADLDWWCNNLAGAPLDPLLKTDYPRSGRPNIGQNQGDIVKVSVHSLHPYLPDV